MLGPFVCILGAPHKTEGGCTFIIFFPCVSMCMCVCVCGRVCVCVCVTVRNVCLCVLSYNFFLLFCCFRWVFHFLNQLINIDWVLVITLNNFPSFSWYFPVVFVICGLQSGFHGCLFKSKVWYSCDDFADCIKFCWKF